MRIAVFITTLLVLLMFGHALKAMIDAGYWWGMPFVFVGVFAFGYWVGDEDDRQGFRDAWARIRSWVAR